MKIGADLAGENAKLARKGETRQVSAKRLVKNVFPFLFVCYVAEFINAFLISIMSALISISRPASPYFVPHYAYVWISLSIGGIILPPAIFLTFYLLIPRMAPIDSWTPPFISSLVGALMGISIGWALFINPFFPIFGVSAAGISGSPFLESSWLEVALLAVGGALAGDRKRRI